MQKKNILVNVLRIFLYCLIAFIFNQIVQTGFPDLVVYPNFFYTLIWVFSYFNSNLWSLFVGILAGFFSDWLFSPFIGMGIFIGILTSVISSNFLQSIWQRRSPFLFVQIIFLQFVSKVLESLINYFSFVFLYELPVQMNTIINNALRDAPMSFIINIGAAVIWFLIIKYILPFTKSDINSDLDNFSNHSQEVI